LDILRRLAGDPESPQLQVHVAAAQEDIGLALHRLKRSAEGLAPAEEGLAIRVKLTEGEPVPISYTLASSYGKRGMVRIGAGMPAEAAADLRHALEIMARSPPLRPGERFDRLQILALLAGLGADARSGVTKEEAAAFADQAIVALAEVVKTGWVLPGDLKDSDFDALRDRSDFQKLFAEVEAHAKAAAKDK
jgi:hypothetical protein